MTYLTQNHFSSESKNNLVAIQNFLTQNQNSQEARSFAMEAIEIIDNGGEVDYVNKLLFTPEFLENECLNGVYDNFVYHSSGFRNYVQNFDGEFPVTNLKFDVSSTLANDTNAVTSPINISSKVITITFNSNKLNRPELDIARTFIHEVIHAEIFRKLFSIIGTNSVGITQQNLNQLQNNFPGIYDYYMRYEWNVPIGTNLTDPQHNMMAQHYRDIIIQAISECDESNHSNEVYNALSWVGLIGSGTVDSATGLPPNPTIAWQNLSQTERLSIRNDYFYFKNNNPPCQ